MKRNFRLYLSLLLALSGSLTTLWGQQTTIFTEANLSYKRGLDFYEKGIYALAQQEFNQAITQLRPIPEPESRLLRGRAELYAAKSAVRLGQPNAEQMILDYIRGYSPDPLATQAIFEMGNYYYNSGDYNKAATFFDMLQAGDVPPAQIAEATFKKGYTYFVKKDFARAKQTFAAVKEQEGEYYYPSNYYYAMCAFFEDNFNEAAKSFQRVEKSKQYADYVPYYLTQIYFAQRDYDKVINYGERIAENGRAKNFREVNQLIGQGYFEKQNFVKAAQYLTIGADGNNRMREEDFYQLGFSQHKIGRYKDAADNLENLNKTNSKLGQNAMFTLGDCYLRLGNRASARSAFAAASKMNFDASIQEDALFNFAKLSYELKYTQEAVNALEGIAQGTKYYNEAQNLLGEVLLQTRDYEAALQIINSIQNKTTKIREAAQKANLYRGIQLLQDGDETASEGYFSRSLADPINLEAKVTAQYWLAELLNRKKDYERSTSYASQFLTAAKSIRTLPDESSVYTGNYLQGYNYLKQKNFASALGYFQDCVAGIKRDEAYIYSDFVKNNVLGDATMRAGDCLFKRNRYDDALKYYNEAIDKKYSGFVYALYQKGIIQGLKGNNVEKLIALEKLAEQYPNAEFTPAALLEAGITYQQMNQLDRASRVLRKLVTDYKGKSELINKAYLQLGLIAQNQGNNEQAITYYKSIFQNNPNSVDARASLDRLQDIYVNDLGKPDEYFDYVKTIPGYNVDGLTRDSISFRAAEAQFEQGAYDKAIQNYTSYLSKFPNGANSTTAYYNRGDSYANLKQYDNALTDYEQVVGRGNSKYYARATEKAALIAYNNSKDFAKAYDYYSKMEASAVSEDKKFEAQLGAMRSAYRTKNDNAVYANADKVANNPRATKEQVANASFYLGKIAFDRKENDKAKTALLKSIANSKDDDQNAEANYFVAYVDYLQRDLANALSRCEKVSQNSSSQYWSAKCVLLEADIYAEKGDLFNARAALEAVRDNFKDNKELKDEAERKLQQLETREKSKSRLEKDKPTDKKGLLEMEKDGN